MPAGTLLLSLSIGLIAVFLIERMIVARPGINVKKVWTAEFILIMVFVFFYAYKTSAFYFTVSDDTKWFATFAQEKTSSKKSHYSFPFNREISIDSNQVIAISKKDIGKKREAVRPSGHKWRGYTWQSRTITVDGRKINLNIFCRPRTDLTYLDYQKMETLLLNELRK